MTVPARLILVHKQGTSARTLFLRFKSGVVAPEPLPALAQVVDEGGAGDVVVHPAALFAQVAASLGLDAGDIELESDFSADVDTPGGIVPVYLGRMTTIDAPLEAAERVGARFIAITEARDLSPVELELLRRAYTCVME